MMRLIRWAARFAVIAGLGAAALAALPRFSGVAALSTPGRGISAQLADMPFGLDRLRGVFPIGPFISAETYFIDQRNNIALRAARAAWRFGASEQPAVPGRQVFVLIIGEASRRDRWELNGYTRPTTPQLTREPGLVSFRNVVTPWTFTTASVPVILSRKGATDRSRLLTEGSILALFHEAGFRTFWLSNQVRPGGMGSPIGQISTEADHSFWLNEAANDVFGNSTHDAVVLPALTRILARDETRQFIVIHLMGSHDSYERRYPADFNRFQPSLTDGPSETADDATVRLRNAYDNSILYTDDVIARILGMLQQTGALAGALYTSDHGESLLDGACTATGHGGAALEQYEVSAFGWLSASYQREFPTALAVLQSHAALPLSTVNVFESLADLAHIRFAGDDPSYSVFSPTLKPHPRMVNVRDHAVDFDAAPRVGPCQEPAAPD